MANNDVTGEEGVRLDKDDDKTTEVGRWLEEIKLSEKAEKDWTDSSINALKVYNGDNFRDQEHTKRKETFNILWSNVETKRPALYNQMPRPDIRRRFRDENPIGKEASELMERAITFSIEEGFDEAMIAAVNDTLLPGRAVTRVKYIPTFGDTPEVTEEVPEPEAPLDYQEIDWEQVQWDDFRRGPGRVWNEVPWEAFRHKFTKDQFEDMFGEDLVSLVSFTETARQQDDKLDKRDKTDDTVFKRTMVWEIWDKEEREVIFISTSYKDKALLKVDDPLNLKDFWPNPRPMYAIESSTSLIPTCEYTMYETLAKELELLTNRLNRIIDGLRLRGVYDSTMPEMETLFDQQDNEFIPAENLSRLVEAGGLEKAIWMLPIKTMAEVLEHLYARRDSLVQEIYQITGISDIQRGESDPNETLGAQQLKANFGSLRMQRQQREVQRYARDLIRLGVEIIAENFSSETLSLMTGLNYPTDEQKQMIQMQMQAQVQQAVQQGAQPPPPDPKMLEMLEKPTWTQIQEVLQSDVLREFRIDIETDSTIEVDQQQDQKNITELLTGVVQFMEGMAPVVQAGILPIEAAKAMLMSAVRRFKLGREVEDALDEMANAPPQDQQPDPAQQAADQERQAAQQTQQLEMQDKQRESKWREDEYNLEMEGKTKEHQVKMAKVAMDGEFNTAQHQQRMTELSRPASRQDG